MTPTDIERVVALADETIEKASKATAGPLTVDEDWTYEVHAGRTLLAKFVRSAHHGPDDALFYCHARTAAPALAAAVRDLAEQLAFTLAGRVLSDHDRQQAIDHAAENGIERDAAIARAERAEAERDALRTERDDLLADCRNATARIEELRAEALRLMGRDAQAEMNIAAHRAEAAELLLSGPARVEKARDGFHMNFNGGWHGKSENEAFHHGMDTVFNWLNEIATKAAVLAPSPAAPVAAAPDDRPALARAVLDEKVRSGAWRTATPRTEPTRDEPIDIKRFRSAPCYLCGYNGRGYFQPKTHPCASRYHRRELVELVESLRMTPAATTCEPTRKGDASMKTKRHPLEPDQCPECKWSNSEMLNYGSPETGSLWMCHGCAARRINGSKLVDSHASRLAAEAGETWELLTDEERDHWAGEVHNVLNHLVVAEPFGTIRDGRNGAAWSATNVSIAYCATCGGWVALSVDSGLKRNLSFCAGSDLIKRIPIEDARKVPACSCPHEERPR